MILPSDESTLVVHNGMTGKPYLADRDDEPDAYDRVVITTDHGQLRYADRRKLGGLWLAQGQAELAELIGRQTPSQQALRSAMKLFRKVVRRTVGKP